MDKIDERLCHIKLTSLKFMQDEFEMTNLGRWSLKTGVKLNYMMTII